MNHVPSIRAESGLPILPADLSSAQRVGLAAGVLLIHGGLAWFVWHSPAPVVREVALPAITATLVTEAARPSALQPPAPAAEPPRPVIASQAPAVLSSPRPAHSPTQEQATPRTELKPVAPTPAAQPAPPPAAAAVAPAVAAAAAFAPALASVNNPPVDTPRPEPKELPITAVRYLVEPPAVYPRASRDLGESGLVVLRVLVDEKGRPEKVSVARSSGFRRLDEQAVRNMNAARFQPHVEAGVPRAVWVSAEIVFNLE